ncbi:hypothetical protein B0H14DRAFT_3167475 [Mycena olivaceomarginata]|nr:hypothetical protein B0H14DRAFT_3167475 [Mycena olivaceomarginata]
MTRATELLSPLKAAGIAAGRRDGLLAKTLTPKYTDDDPPVAVLPSDAKDGNYAAFSNQWERVFQLKSSTDLPESKYPFDVEMMLPRVEALLRLIPAAIKAYEEKARNPLPFSVRPASQSWVKFQEAERRVLQGLPPMCIVTKERLKSGLGEGLNWTEVLNIHEY